MNNPNPCHDHDLDTLHSLSQDYDDFDLANEDDELEEFLGIPRKTPKAVPAGEATDNGDVGKLEGSDVSNGEAPTSQPAPSADDPVPMDVEKSV